MLFQLLKIRLELVLKGMIVLIAEMHFHLKAYTSRASFYWPLLCIFDRLFIANTLLKL